MCCATPMLWHRMPLLRGLRLSPCWKRTFERPVVTFRWRNGRNSRTYCKDRSWNRRSSPLRDLRLPPACGRRIDIWKPRPLQRWSTLRSCDSGPKICCETRSQPNRISPLPGSRWLSFCWKACGMWRLRPLPRQRCGLVQLAQNCGWFLRESSSNSCDSRQPQKRSRRCLPSLLRMDGPGSNTARSCGTPSTGPIAPSSAPEIFRETIALCSQGSPNSFYTISITRKLRSITSDFSIFIRTCGTIL